MKLEELHKKKKLTIKKTQNQQGQEVLETSLTLHDQFTGDPLPPQVQITGTKEQLEAGLEKLKSQVADAEFLLRQF